MTNPNLNPTPKELRQFGIGMTLFLALIGGLVIWRGHRTLAIDLWIVGVIVFFLPALLFPTGLKPIYRIWMKIALVISVVTSRVILSVLYYTVFTLVSIIQKILRRDVLEREFPGGKESYWIDRSKDEYNPKHFERLF